MKIELWFFLVLSVSLQIVVAILAWRLIRITRHKLAWLAICLALLLMVFRRGLVVHELVAGGIFGPYDLAEESIAFGVSVLFLIGIIAIRDLFQSIRRTNEALVEEVAEGKRVQGQKEELILELQTAMAQVKQLSGMLPICGSCKKIRNDAGYWEQIEEYIRDHSEAEFSHGICPECLERLYPDFKLDSK